MNNINQQVESQSKKARKAMNKAKEIILEELREQGHPERVEDVIFWALEYYYKNRKKGTWGEVIASCIVQRIKESERNN